MDSTQLQTRIHQIVEDLDKMIPLWAKAKADHNYATEMKQVTLNMEKAKSEAKTVSAREEEAYRSEAYTKYLWKVFEIDSNFYSLDGRKGLLEKELDACRSLLSYEREMTKRTS